MNGIFFLGAGKMATAICGGLVKSGLYKAGELAASETFADCCDGVLRFFEKAAHTGFDEIARRAQEIMSTSRFKLLEALGYALGQMLLEYPPVRRATVRLEKPRALPDGAAEIVMEFDRAAQEGRRDG